MIKKQKYDVYLANDLDTILGVFHGSTRHAQRIFDAHEWFEEVDELQNKTLSAMDLEDHSSPIHPKIHALLHGKSMVSKYLFKIVFEGLRCGKKYSY